jgi:hypothetical protein
VLRGYPGDASRVRAVDFAENPEPNGLLPVKTLTSSSWKRASFAKDDVLDLR